MTLRRLPAICVVLAALAGAAPAAWAQADLPASIVTATTLSAEQVAQASQFVQSWLPKLVSDDPTEVKHGRDSLLEPLRNTGATVAFRQKYSEMLLNGVPPGGGLEKLSTSDKDSVAVNALRVAGELATADAANLLVQHLTDPAAATAFSAARGLGRTFAAISAAAGVPSITPAGVLDLVARLGEEVAREKNPEVAGAAVRSLIDATAIVRPGFEEVRPIAFGTLCKQCGARAMAVASQPQPLWIDDLPTMLWVTTAARDALAQQNPAVALSLKAIPGQPKGTVGAAAELAGHMLGTMVRRIKDLPPGESHVRDQCIDLANLAEQCLVVAVPALNGQYQSHNLANNLKAGTPAGDNQFVRDAIDAISTLRGVGLGPFLDDNK